MTPEQIKLNMAVMTPKGKGVVVGWGSDGLPYLVKIEGYSGHNGRTFQLVSGSTETLDNDGHWFHAEDLTAIEEPMTEPTHYSDWEKLTALPIGARPDEKEGTRFVVIDDDGHSHFRNGEIIELIENDGTACPYFKRTNECERIICSFRRIAPLPQTEEKKVKKLVPFTDEFDWCEEGVLVMINDRAERYIVRAVGDVVWSVDYGEKLSKKTRSTTVSTYSRDQCQKVIQEAHRPLTNREFAEFLQDHKGMVQDASESLIYNNSTRYDCGDENEPVFDDILFRFRGTEDWYPATTELYEIAKGLNS